MLAAVALFAVLDGIVKALDGKIGIAQIILFRSAFAFLPLAVAVHRGGGLRCLATTRPGYHLARGLLGLVSMAAFFAALPRMALADVIAISFSGPLFIAMLAGSVLGEPIGARRWLAICAGLGGVMLIVRPGSTVFQPASLLPLLGALSYSFIMLLVRRTGERESLLATAFHFTVVTAAVGAVLAPLAWTWPDARQWGLLVAAGLAGGCANLCLTQAFRLSPVGQLAPLEYTALLWGLIFGYLFWSELPDAPALLGCAIIVVSGLAVTTRQWSRIRPRV